MAKTQTLTLKIKTPIEDLFERFYGLLSVIKEQVVGQDEALASIATAILLRQHCMLIGPAGEAKTAATRLFVNAFERTRVFDMLMTSGTQPEELFGPMDLAKWRDEKHPELRYRTEGYLPTAHFVILDELFRAPHRLHSVLFRALNEREFNNGNEIMPIPLRSAIATTNFIPDDTELTAFIDRFPWVVRVGPLTLAKKMALLPKIWEGGDDFEQPTVELDPSSLERLRKFIFRTEVPEDMSELFHQLIKEFAGANPDVSTRTLIFQSGRLLQLICAEAKCYGQEPDLAVFKMFANMWGVTMGGKDAAFKFETAFTSVIGKADQTRREIAEANAAFESFDWDAVDVAPSSGKLAAFTKRTKTGKGVSDDIREALGQVSDALLKVDALHARILDKLPREKREHLTSQKEQLRAAELALQDLVRIGTPPSATPFASAASTGKGVGSAGDLAGFMAGLGEAVTASEQP